MAGEEVGAGTGGSDGRSAAVRWQEGTLFSLLAAWPVACVAQYIASQVIRTARRASVTRHNPFISGAAATFVVMLDDGEEGAAAAARAAAAVACSSSSPPPPLQLLDLGLNVVA